MNWGSLIIGDEVTAGIVKTMSTCRKINSILVNTTINLTTLANICRYKLATKWQNFMEIFLAQAKILQKVSGEVATFLLTLYIHPQ